MNILITGGLGFLGSNLATLLSLAGESVTILDNLDPRYGGNEFNLHDARLDKVEVVRGDVRDKKLIASLVRDKQCVYHLAAQVSYIDSLKDPLEDMEVNCGSTLSILDAIREFKQDTRVVFASSRMVYGKILEAPVRETHPVHPISLYGIHKSNAERYCQLYGSEFGIPYTIVRITNPYGIKQQIKHNKYSLVGWFIREAMDNKTIRIFGAGEQKRDYIFSADIVAALAAIRTSNAARNQVYNLGYGRSSMFKDMVSSIVQIVGTGKVEHVPWPKDYESVETGDFDVSIEKVQKDLQWKPEVSLEQGIKRTMEYYRRNMHRYV